MQRPLVLLVLLAIVAGSGCMGDGVDPSDAGSTTSSTTGAVPSATSNLASPTTSPTPPSTSPTWGETACPEQAGQAMPVESRQFTGNTTAKGVTVDDERLAARRLLVHAFAPNDGPTQGLSLGQRGASFAANENGTFTIELHVS